MSGDSDGDVESGSTEFDSFLREVARGDSRVANVTAGMKLGPYEVVGVLGRGGMGVVFRAVDLSFGDERRRSSPRAR